MEEKETIKYRGYDIKIYYDECPESPREWDNLGIMVCFHRRYSLGDSHNFNEPEDFIEFVRENNPIVLPLFLYNHSGISMSTRSFIGRAHHAEWDSGQVGWIYVEKEKIKKEYGWKKLTKKRREKIIQYLIGEVETYDNYLTGEVYGFMVEKDGDDVDSCWGFYGDEGLKCMIGEAKTEIDFDIQRRRKKHFDQVKTWIRNRVPLQYRTPLQLAL